MSGRVTYFFSNKLQNIGYILKVNNMYLKEVFNVSELFSSEIGCQKIFQNYQKLLSLFSHLHIRFWGLPGQTRYLSHVEEWWYDD